MLITYLFLLEIKHLKIKNKKNKRIRKSAFNFFLKKKKREEKIVVIINVACLVGYIRILEQCILTT